MPGALVSAQHSLSRFFVAVAVTMSLATPLALASGLGRSAAAASLTTAWQNGAFSLNPQGVVSRSDVVLGRPDTASSQSPPLGGTLVNPASGKCLDVYGAGSNTGQQLDQWPCKNAPGTNQDFNSY
jgi:Ricin-type beta-trefoil lectin domain-like